MDDETRVSLSTYRSSAQKGGVPTPKEVLGCHIGEPKRLTYTADQQRFFRALEKAVPRRVKTMVIGRSEEGRDILVAYVTSEANLEKLEVNRQSLKRLADPRGFCATYGNRAALIGSLVNATSRFRGHRGRRA